MSNIVLVIRLNTTISLIQYILNIVQSLILLLYFLNWIGVSHHRYLTITLDFCAILCSSVNLKLSKPPSVWSFGGFNNSYETINIGWLLGELFIRSVGRTLKKEITRIENVRRANKNLDSVTL